MLNRLKNVIKRNKYTYNIARILIYPYTRYRNKKEIQRIKNGTFVHKYNVNELFLQQNEPDGYNRLDIIVRLLAIEEEYGLNNFGWGMYRKMQQARVGSCTDCTIDERVDTFKKLIKSWEENGYDETSKIVLDQELKLLDGSHRIALCLFHGQKDIMCEVLGKKENVFFGKEWFAENDFTIEELIKIDRRAEEIIQSQTIRISCLLWPAVYDYFEEIIEKLGLFYDIEDSGNFVFKGETFNRFIQAVYCVDDIAQWKIDKKKEYLSPYNNVVRLFNVKLENPVYRFKDLNKNLLLTQGETIKRMIRNCYSNKLPVYFGDIIMHSADNVDQSDFINRLCAPMFNVCGLFDRLSDLRWYIIKLENEYITDDFPNTVPFGKDLDVLCKKEDFDDLIERVSSYFDEVALKYYDKLKVIRDHDSNCRIRLELRGNLIYQIDVSCELEGIYGDFIESCLERRKKVDNYYILSAEDEICFRLIEYMAHPQKERHALYMKNHSSEISVDKISKAVIDKEKAVSVLRNELSII